MVQKKFHNNTLLQKNKGFTLVEISIVMIIIGLLIGGIFGGMKLIDNANIQKTVQDIKAIESAALTFRDTYRALPGDIRTPNTRIPNCTVAPCATGGNGDRNIGAMWSALVGTQTTADETFTFWSHLQAADLLNLGTKNILDLNYGEGQPEAAAIGGGFRIYRSDSWPWIGGTTTVFNNTSLSLNVLYHAAPVGTWDTPCDPLRQIDIKIDDGFVYNGFLQGWACGTGPTSPTGSQWVAGGIGNGLYDLKGF